MLKFIECDENKTLILDVECKDGKFYAKVEDKYIEIINMRECNSNKIYVFDASIYGHNGVPNKIEIGEYVEV